MGFKKKNKKNSGTKSSELIEKTNSFMKIANEALKLLSKEKLLELLEYNSIPYENEMVQENLVTFITEYMTYGIVKPCPKCDGELKLTKYGYVCDGKKGAASSGKCRFKSFSPPHIPFAIPENFEDAPFFKEFVFTKYFRDFRGSNEAGEDGDGTHRKKSKGYIAALRENKQFEEYYSNQGVVPEGQFDEFMQVLKQPLPSTFRVTGFGRSGKQLQQAIEEDYFSEILGNYKVGNKDIDPPTSLPWYPDNLAWQLDTDRKSIRHIPALMKLKQFLVSETNSGNISRQEAVSMIPPLVLDVKPQHKVLDMCAAPGSKTSQLIEFLHADEAKSVPEGIVVANDNDNKRCYLMCHQVKRLQTPCFLVINHDASQLPGFRLDDDLMKFDRVLADVPCTGDGTFRKNVDAWQKWNPAMAHNLHTVQTRILRRGLEVLKTGGRLVYSTCSLNPIENEAVVASVLAGYPADVQILDVKDELPGLKFLPGLDRWKVMSRNGDWYSQVSEVPEKLRTQIFSAMFPPSKETAEKLNLNRCMRVLPHLQNTGGFFITVLQKNEDAKEKTKKARQDRINEANAASEASEKETDGDDESRMEPGVQNMESDKANHTGKRKETERSDYDNPLPLKKQKLKGYKEDPFIFLEKDDPVLDAIKEFYGLDESFPADQLLVRCKEGKKRNLYFVSKAVKDIAQDNEDKIKFINMGVKVFSRSESKYCTACDYRLVQEGIEVLYPYLTKRKIYVSSEDIVKLLTRENPFITQFSKPVQHQLNELDSEGSLVYVFDPDLELFNKVEKPRCKLIITGWKGVVSARTFLPVADRSHFLRLCGVQFKTKEELEIEKSKRDAGEEGGESDGQEEIEEASEQDDGDTGTAVGNDVPNNKKSNENSGDNDSTTESVENKQDNEVVK